MSKEEEKYLYSKSPTIPVSTCRMLAELQPVNPMLTVQEANSIFQVYLKALERITKENK